MKRFNVLIHLLSLMFVFTSCNEELTKITAKLADPNALGSVIPEVVSSVTMPQNTTRFLELKVSSTTDNFRCTVDFISIVSSNKTLIDSDQVSIVGTAPLCELGLSPKLNQSGVAQIDVLISDGVQRSEASFTLTVEVPGILSFKTVPTYPTNVPIATSSEYEYVITNSGEKSATSISVDTLTAPFSVLTGNADDCGSSLSPGEECKLRIRYTSEGETASPITRNLRINYNNQATTTSLNALMTVTGSPYTATISAQHSNGANLLQWIENNNSNVYDSANNVVCDHTSISKRSDCLHGGTLLQMVLTNYSTCTGLTASDTLNAFNWECYVDGTPNAVIYSTGFKEGVGIKDLVNPTSFKANTLNVQLGDNTVYRSDNASGIWWTNTVKIGPRNSTGNPVFTDSSGVSSGDILTYNSDFETNGFFIRTSNIAMVGIGSSKIKASFADNDTTNTSQCSVVDGTPDTGASGRAAFVCIPELPSQYGYFWFENFEIDGDFASGQSLQNAFQIFGGYFGTYYNLDIYNVEDNLVLYQADNIDETKFNSFKDITFNTNLNTSTSTANGIDFDSANITGTELINVTINNISGTSVDLSAPADCANVTISDLTLTNTNTGINLNCANSRLRLKNVSISTTLSDAISCTGTPSRKILQNLRTANIDGAAISCGTGTEFSILNSNLSNHSSGIDVGANSIIIGSVLSGASGNHLDLDDRTNIHNNTISSAAGNGVVFRNYTTFNNNAVINNGGRAFLTSAGDFSNFSNTIATNNGFGFDISSSSNINVYGSFVLGNTTECSISGGSAVSFTNTTCSSTGAENEQVTLNGSDARFYFGKTADSSFVGSSTDSTNTTSLISTQANQSYSNIDDWLNFDNMFKTFLKYDAAFTSAFPSSDNQNSCVSGDTCGVYDYSLRSDDSLIKNSVGFYKDPGIYSPTDRFPSDDADPCPSELDGDEFFDDNLRVSHHAGINAIEDNTDALGNDNGVCEDGEACYNRYLKNAIEVLDDDIGDDDGLCETGETCIYTSNIGAYQGSGDTSRTCVFQDNTITGVTIYKYIND